MRKYAFLLVLVGATSIAHAEAQYSAEYSKCMDKAAGVTADTITCIGTEVAQQDKKLNANYKTLKASLNPTRQKQLQEVQKIWLHFRDSNCQFYADPEGGSLQRVLANECVLKLTTQRAQELVDLRELL